MEFLEFEVNQSLEIVNFNEDFGRLSIPNSRSFHGTPYHELLPRIISDNNDIVESVITLGKPISLEGYKFGCFFDSLAADIAVSPVWGENIYPSGALVRIHFIREGDFFYSFRKCQHLIDIGKNASILAHGVRNPLNAIKGSVAYLKNRYGNESVLLEFTDIIEEEITRLDKFITEFLSVSSNKNKKEKINLSELIRKIEILTKIQAKMKNVEIEFEYNTEIFVYANLFQLEQAILNVINNAFSVSKLNGKIKVQCEKENYNNRRLAVIDILDNGCGFLQKSGAMDSSSLEMFAEGNGKGFGLFISREVMKHHGGMLEIRSEKGKGTSIKLCLPLESPVED